MADSQDCFLKLAPTSSRNKQNFSVVMISKTITRAFYVMTAAGRFTKIPRIFVGGSLQLFVVMKF